MSKKELIFLSLNIFGMPFLSPQINKRCSLICKTIKSLDVDLVNFQEVHTYITLNKLRHELGSHPYCVYKPGLFGPCGGLVTFSKIPIKKTQYVSYGTNIDKTLPKTIANLFFKKGVLLYHIAGNIAAINTHFTSYHKDDIISKQLCPVHLKEIDQLAKLANSLKDQKSVIISGDFNIAKSSSLYDELIKRLKVKDIFASEKSATYHKEFLPKNQKAQRIDYVLTKGNIKTTKKKLLFTKKHVIQGKKMFLSDHLGLLVDFNL